LSTIFVGDFVELTMLPEANESQHANGPARPDAGNRTARQRSPTKVADKGFRQRDFKAGVQLTLTKQLSRS
jgi:hypothetical protein